MTNETEQKSNELLKELGVEVLNADQMLWKRVADSTKDIIKGAEDSLVVNRAILEMAEDKIKALASK